MILTGMAFTHISFLEYYHSEDELMTSVRDLVDELFNCEDIALNFVQSMLTCEGPLLVFGKGNMDRQASRTGISTKAGHLKKRDKCLRRFEKMFGYIPLHDVTGYLRRGVHSQS
jgi:hypothetical protein